MLQVVDLAKCSNHDISVSDDDDVTSKMFIYMA